MSAFRHQSITEISERMRLFWGLVAGKFGFISISHYTLNLKP